jgi:hypothetical protein
VRQTVVCTELHTYQCRVCKTIMTTPLKLQPGERRYSCVSCYGSMWFLFSSPITTEHEKALARRGSVYNPHIQKCPICGDYGYAMYRGRPGDNRMYCSAAHADASIPRTKVTK